MATLAEKVVEKRLLEKILAGEGGLVELRGLTYAEHSILMDLFNSGVIKGQSTTEGGSFSANRYTRQYFEQRFAPSAVEERSEKRKNRKRTIALLLGAFASISAFVWFLATEVLVPEATCSQLPSSIAELLQYCDLDQGDTP